MHRFHPTSPLLASEIKKPFLPTKLAFLLTSEQRSAQNPVSVTKSGMMISKADIAMALTKDNENLKLGNVKLV